MNCTMPIHATTPACAREPTSLPDHRAPSARNHQTAAGKCDPAIQNDRTKGVILSRLATRCSSSSRDNAPSATTSPGCRQPIDQTTEMLCHNGCVRAEITAEPEQQKTRLGENHGRVQNNTSVRKRYHVRRLILAGLATTYSPRS